MRLTGLAPWEVEADAARSCEGPSSQFENNYLAEMCSGSEEGAYLRLIDFLYHSTLGLRVIKKKLMCRARSSHHLPADSPPFRIY